MRSSQSAALRLIHNIVVKIERVTFHSEGTRLVGLLKTPDRTPDGGARPWPTIVQGPGWLGLAASPTSQPFHAGFVDAGYAVLIFDYRGFGESDGERGWVRPEWQVEDILSAMSYVETRDELDAGRMGLFGLGGTGGGGAIYAAAVDPRPRCVVAQTVVADGRAWLRGMRREHEWLSFVERVEENRRRRVATGEDELVDPREELMVATPERKADHSRRETDARVGGDFHLSSAESLIAFRPIDVVDRIAPRGVLLTCVENDGVTPEDHAIALYERAGAPKKLIRQTGVRHYESYRANYDRLMPEFLDWYGRFLRPEERVEIEASDGDPGQADAVVVTLGPK
jgi:dipeptidyl aminopeptidase/acylaminoacyl peptidase